MIAAILFALNLAQLWRDTNSYAATAHGIKAFAQKEYPAAAAAFARANGIAPSQQRAFNLGTAQIAAGDREQGSSTLSAAMNDRRLRADALFNRGNSALGSKAFDSAIRDFSDALRLRPGDRAAKRNLEIAMARKNAMQQGGGGEQKPQKGASQPGQSRAQRQPVPGDQQQRSASTDEAMLRSVQQQEQEELRRMHQGQRERLHVGW